MTVQDSFLALINYEIFNTPPSEEALAIAKANLPLIYSTAKLHDLAHLIGSALYKLSALSDDEISQKFQKQQEMAFFRYIKLEGELNSLCKLFEENGIDYVPLKGSVIRKLYPKPELRTSCDIDILIREEDIDRALDLLIQKLGYTSDKRKHVHDVHLYSQGGIHFELHFNLLEDLETIDRGLSLVWDYLVKDEKTKHRYGFKIEFMLYHLLAHMTHHFHNGGCGIRSFIDIRLILNNYSYDEAELDRLCEIGELTKFKAAVWEMMDIWFGDGQHTEITRSLEAFLLNGGNYGTITAGAAVHRNRTGSKARQFMRRIIQPRHQLELMYPSLKKRPWLNPLFQVRRWFGIVFSKRLRRAMHEFRAINNVTEEETRAAARIFDYVGLELK